MPSDAAIAAVKHRVCYLGGVLLAEAGALLEGNFDRVLVPGSVQLKNFPCIDHLSESDCPHDPVPDQLAPQVGRHLTFICALCGTST
eukprot:943914-Rhodomonas_salina.1